MVIENKSSVLEDGGTLAKNSPELTLRVHNMSGSNSVCFAKGYSVFVFVFA